jgi:acetyl-CoA carboxylase biotin carboxyl carrier protein
LFFYKIKIIKMATSKKAAPVSGKAAPKKAAPKQAVAKKSNLKTPVAKADGKSKSVAAEAQKMPNAIFNINEINDLLNAVNHSNVNELKLEKGDFKITIRQGMAMTAAPAQVIHSAPAAHHVAAHTPPPAAPAAATPAAAPPADTSADNLITIKSPMIGTFYRSAGPGKPTFVNVGDEIKVGQVICIVEAMKLFNEIESEVSGRVVKVLADDSSPVEYDQPLFLVEP